MIKNNTAKFAIEFYKKLGSEGMSSLTTKERDEAMLRFILKFLKKKDTILDLACGYGRITFALKNLGYEVRGVDISPNLIRDARKRGKELGHRVDFKVGDMRKLPYPSESFDKIICLWSSFNHLLNEEDQIGAINEIYRTLKRGGVAIIDMPNGETKWAKDNINKQSKIVLCKYNNHSYKNKIKTQMRIVPDIINGLEVKNYLHDRLTLKRICNKSHFRKYKIGFANISRRRIIVLLIK
jgi:ubiquinone/menaquinone biosynthesis C-methylase UbiE